MNQLGISVSVARISHGKGISIDMYRSLVRSVDRVDVLGLQSRAKNKHVPCSYSTNCGHRMVIALSPTSLKGNYPFESMEKACE